MHAYRDGFGSRVLSFSDQPDMASGAEWLAGLCGSGAEAEAGEAVADAHVAPGEGCEILPLRGPGAALSRTAALLVLPRIKVGRLEDGVLEPVGVGVADCDVHLGVFAAEGVGVDRGFRGRQ